MRRKALLTALACGLVAPWAATAHAAAPAVRLTGAKTYLLARSQSLVDELHAERVRAERYYALARRAGFDYSRLWARDGTEVASLLAAAKRGFDRAHRAYEEEEGIVAGVPSLARYDVILDSGTSAAGDPRSAAPFDLTLPDGRVLHRPGSFFHALLEPALYGIDARFVARGGRVDLDRDGRVEFGEALPDANVLLGILRGFERHARASAAQAAKWQPTASDVFTALVVMVPTVEGYFGEWRSSRFVAGGAAKQPAFVSHSRLVDVHGILFSLRRVYAEIRPLVAAASRAQADLIGAQLASLAAFVDAIRAKERSGRRFTPAEADLLGRESQKRANAIAGQIGQVAALLGVKLQA